MPACFAGHEHWLVHFPTRTLPVHRPARRQTLSTLAFVWIAARFRLRTMPHVSVSPEALALTGSHKSAASLCPLVTKRELLHLIICSFESVQS